MFASVTLVRQIATTGNAAAIKQGCTALRTEVGAAKALSAAPDSQLRTALAGAVTNYDAAAAACLRGAVSSAVASFGKGDAWGEKAMARLEALAHTH